MSQTLANWCLWRIKKDKNAIIVINGGTGSGKSWAALDWAVKIAGLNGTNFTVDDNIAFNFADLIRKSMREVNENPGTVLLFEEAGAFGGGGSSREWQSKANIFFNSFLQTDRHRNQILIMTCPEFTYLDASSRKLVHLQCEMLGINYNNKTSFLKPYQIQINKRTGKMYFKLLRMLGSGGKSKIKCAKMNMPPKNILKEYNKVKHGFTKALKEKILMEDELKNRKTKPLTLKQEEWLELWNEGKSVKEIAEILGYNLPNSYQHKKMIENKGYMLEKPPL